MTQTQKKRIDTVFNKKFIKKDNLIDLFSIDQPIYKLNQTILKMEREQQKKIKELEILKKKLLTEE